MRFVLYAVIAILCAVVVWFLHKLYSKTKRGNELQTSDIIGLLGLLLTIIASIWPLTTYSDTTAPTATPSIIAPTIPPTAARPQDTDQNISAAQKAFARSGGLDEAIHSYEAAVKATPTNAEALAWLSFLYEYRYRKGESEQTARLAVAANPDSAFAHAALANALDSQDKHDEADREATAAIDLDGNASLGYSIRTYIRATEGYQKADEALLDAAEKDALLADDRAKRESEGFFKALAANARGMLLYRRYQLSPANSPNLLTILNDAIRAFTEASKEQPQLALFDSNLAYFYLFQADQENRTTSAAYHSAEASFKGALAKDPQYATAKAGLGWIAYRNNDKTEAARLFAEAKRIEPLNSDGYDGMNTILRENKDFPAAIAEIEQARANDPRNFNLLLTLGDTYRDQMNATGDQTLADTALFHAQQAYSAALAIEPRYYLALRAQGFLLMDREQYTPASELFTRAVGINGDDAGSQAGLGWCLYYLKPDDPQAAVHLQHATELDPTYAWAWKGLGLTLYTNGKTDQAISSFEQAIKYDPSDTEAIEALDRAKQ